MTIAPRLPLALPFTTKLRTEGFWVFEKIDGIRAFYNQGQLFTRSGSFLPLNLNLPSDLCFDGELFNGSFERTIQALKSGNLKTCNFNIFDAWNDKSRHLSFSDRFQKLSDLSFADSRCSLLPPLGVVSHPSDIDHYLQSVLAAGGEGLILRDPSAVVTFGRSPSLIKVKGHFDADGRVVEWVVCKKGKMYGRLAALVIEVDTSETAAAAGSNGAALPAGALLRVGSGLTELDRMQPPAIGSRVTFGWKQVFESGLPKSPFFVRMLPSSDRRVTQTT